MRALRLVAGLGSVAVAAIAGIALTLDWIQRTGSGDPITETNHAGETVLVGQEWSSAAEVAAPMLFIAVVAAMMLFALVAVSGDQ